MMTTETFVSEWFDGGQPIKPRLMTINGLSPLFFQALSVWDDAMQNLVGAHQAAKLAAQCSLATHLYREKGMQDMRLTMEG